MTVAATAMKSQNSRTKSFKCSIAGVRFIQSPVTGGLSCKTSASSQTASNSAMSGDSDCNQLRNYTAVVNGRYCPPSPEHDPKGFIPLFVGTPVVLESKYASHAPFALSPSNTAARDAITSRGTVEVSKESKSFQDSMVRVANC